jgi:hypothetical protein
MDVKQNNVENVDEAWILKYRAALKNLPKEEPRFAKTFEVIRALRTKVTSHINHWLLTTGQPKREGAPKAVQSIPVREPGQGLKAS